MKRPVVCALLIIIFSMAETANAGWIEKKGAIVKGINWNRPVAYGDKTVFEGGGGVAGKKIKTGTFVYDAATNKLDLLTSESIDTVKSLYENNLVFMKRETIYLVDIKNKSKKKKILGPGNSPPDIYLNNVVYIENGVPVIHDLKTGKKKTIKHSTDIVFSNDIGPVIWGDTVAWVGKRGGQETTLFFYNITEGEVKKEVELPDNVKYYYISTLRFRDGVVLISGAKGVYIYDVNQGSLKQLEKDPAFVSNVNNGKVVWDHNGGNKLTLYDIATGGYADLISEKGEVNSAAPFKDRVLFVDTKEHELRMFEFKK